MAWPLTGLTVPPYYWVGAVGEELSLALGAADLRFAFLLASWLSINSSFSSFLLALCFLTVWTIKMMILTTMYVRNINSWNVLRAAATACLFFTVSISSERARVALCTVSQTQFAPADRRGRECRVAIAPTLPAHAPLLTPCAVPAPADTCC